MMTITEPSNQPFPPAGRRLPAAFTLIELLIVVAIIAILAAIAVPNFLEAQTRSKVSRAKSDQRTVRLALEAYVVDNNSYPYVISPEWVWHPCLLDIPTITTPIAYMSSMLTDPFPLSDPSKYYGSDPIPRGEYYRYYRVRRWVVEYPEIERLGLKWVVMSNGPDLDIEVNDDAGARDTLNGKTYMYYDPSNGTVSRGDLIGSNLKPSQ